MAQRKPVKAKAPKVTLRQIHQLVKLLMYRVNELHQAVIILRVDQDQREVLRAEMGRLQRLIPNGGLQNGTAGQAAQGQGA